MTTSFGFDFKATAAGEVIAVDQSGAPISAALYSVTLDSDEGGTLTFSVAPLLSDYSEIYVVGDPALTQPSDFDNAGPSFNPAALTKALDRAAARDLKQQREIDRGFKVPFGESGFMVPRADDRANAFLSFGPDGNPVMSSGTGADAGLRGDLGAAADPGKGAALVWYVPPEAAAIGRPSSAKLGDFVDARDWGARFDWNGVMGTDNYGPIMTAIAVAKLRGGLPVMLPEGVGYLSQAIVNVASASYYSLTPVVSLVGRGANTVLTRNIITPVDITNEAACRASAAIVWAASNGIIDQLTIRDSGAGIVFTESPTAPVNPPTTSVTMGRSRALWIKGCGVGAITFAPLNFYYNWFDAFHIMECQIGIALDWHPNSPYVGAVANCNRNRYSGRISRCWVALWNKAGGTNHFDIDIEGCSGPTPGTAPSGNRYAMPSGLPGGLAVAGAVINGAKSNLNFYRGVYENNDFDIYNEGLQNSFVGDFDAAKCTFVKAPWRFVIPEQSITTTGNDSAVTSLTATPHLNTKTYQGVVVPALTHYQLADRGRELVSTSFGDKHFMANGKTHRRIVDCGAFTSGQAKVIAVQSGVSSDDYMSDSVGILSGRLVGFVTGAGQAIAAKFDILYLRATNRSTTRVFLFNQVNGQATGSGTGGSSNPFTLAATANGTDARIIDLTVTAPALAFDRVILFIDEAQAKDKDL
ncbi:hypothetical protein ATM17_21620 [Sphingopyxis macrogoltabida]|uniref:Uncharacterized protein n=1 Tax=Sphingopyxis macrogoltabida TaxID=33050 RepID=A0AAC9FGK4_SPHMC|nr:hypothetical protein ATM17_21620 [Sphingopyxis macrogoltabida]